MEYGTFYLSFAHVARCYKPPRNHINKRATAEKAHSQICTQSRWINSDICNADVRGKHQRTGHASLLLSDNISYYIPVICDNNSRYLTYLFLFLSTWPFICCSQKRSTGNSVYQALRTNTFSSHFSSHFKPFLIYVYYLIHSSYYPFQWIFYRW